MDKALYKTLKNGVFCDVSQRRSETMRSIKGRGNRSTEVRFRLALVRARIKGWQIHQQVERGRPDILFTKEKVAVFLDGCFWHGCSKCAIPAPKTNAEFWRTKISCNRERDIRTTALLETKGIQVFRVWEHELGKDLGDVIFRLQTMLRHSSQGERQRAYKVS